MNLKSSIKILIVFLVIIHEFMGYDLMGGEVPIRFRNVAELNLNEFGNPGISFQVLFSHNNTWVLTDLREGIKCIQHDGNQWLPEKIITSPNEYISDMSSLIDGDGKPMVFWRTVGDIRWAVYKNGSWAKPEMITAKAMDYLTCCVDSKNNIHLIYAARMDPPEAYGVGFPIAEGQFPSKYFHRVYDGKQWSNPASTTGRGRFGIRNPTLIAASSGKVYLATSYSPFPRFSGDMYSYVAYQEYKDGKWSTFKRLSPPVSASSYNIAFWVDSREIIHALWDENVTDLKYGCSKNGNVAETQLIANGTFCESMVMDAKDRLYLGYSSQGAKLCIANKNKWSKPIDINSDNGIIKMFVDNMGRVFVVSIHNNKLVIQEVLDE